VDEEPQPLRHLRCFSSYLFPHPGIFSTDTWTVILIWARNVTINLLMLLPLSLMVVVLARLSVYAYGLLNTASLAEDSGSLLSAFLIPLVIGFSAMVVALINNARSLREFRMRDPRDRLACDPRDVNGAVHRQIVYPAAIAAMFLTVSIRWLIWKLGAWVGQSPPIAAEEDQISVVAEIQNTFSPYFGLVNWSSAVMHAGLAGLIGAALASRRRERVPSNPSVPRAGAARSIGAGFLVGATVGLGLLAGEMLLRHALWDYITAHLELLEPPTFLAHMVVFGLITMIIAWKNARRDEPNVGKIVVAALVAGMTGGFLLVLLEGLLKEFALWRRPDLMAAFVPPGALLIAVASLIVEIALLGRSVSEGEREWSARISALLTKVALFWLTGAAIILYLPGLFLSSGVILRTLIASGWFGTAVVGVGTGHYLLPKAGKAGALTLTQLAAIASMVFLAGLLGAVALLGSVLLNTPALYDPPGTDVGPFGYYIEGVNGTTLTSLILVGSGAVVLYYIARQLIDVNLFSLNAMYANRLTRCYLGASRPLATWPERWALPRDTRANAGAPSISDAPGAPVPSVRDPNPVTGFDPHDDLDLRALRIGKPQPPAAGATQGDQAAERRYWGPHLLINTTLNLVGSDELALRSRKGESFTLSPLYCGAKTVGYAKLDQTQHHPHKEPNLTLGRAISISGAAVDPNMSFYQSAPLTALLTIFNARLGYWIQTPGAKHWTAKSPRAGDFDLFLTEFFGRTDERGAFVHISDGGHFDNLGVYELIRRRCRYIVALDAEDDWDASDDNLANLIRLCRIDFGVRIQIDTSPLKPEGPDRLTRTHVAIGRIRYDDVDQGEMPGVLVYVKSSLTGDEQPDLQKYARNDQRFPHQPTDFRQSFDEELFECYRCLGDHIAWDVFADAVGQANKEPGRRHSEYVPRLFSKVQNRWTEPPQGENEHFLQLAKLWSELQRDLGARPELAGLSRDLYPELGPAPLCNNGQGDPGEVDRARAEVHAVSRMLQMMEDA
jgi:hypothetical protein